MRRWHRPRPRAAVALVVALAAALPLVFLGSGAAPAADEPPSFEQNPRLFTVTQVRLNSSGGITVTGRIDCTNAVEAWGQTGHVAAVNVNWTARQPIGRKGVVTAQYTSVIMELCFDPDVYASGVEQPYPWATHPPITSGDIWWIYPDNGGKFVGGKIHIEAQVTGGLWGTDEEDNQYMITGVIQWDGRVTKK